MKIPSNQELAGLKTQDNFALALKASTIIVAVIAIYFQDLNLIFTDALYNESTSHILLIPLLLAYLVYRKRKMLRAAAPTQSRSTATPRYLATLSGILLCATAIVLYWYGSYTFTPLEYHVLTLPVFTAGLTLILFNPQTLRQLAFPIAFLFFLTPPPLEVTYGLGATLSVISSEASTAIVNLFGIPATLTGEYGTPTIMLTRPDNTTMSFAVDIACSGIYSLIGFLIFATFIAFIVRDKLWKKTLTFIMGFPLIYLLNIIRITIILLIGYQWGEQLALDIFHLLGGWILIFLGTLLLLAISEKILKTKVFTRRQNPCPICSPLSSLSTETYCKSCGRILKFPQTRISKTDIAKIISLALAAFLLLSIQAPVFALTQSPAQILIQTPSGEQGNPSIFPEIPGYSLQFFYRDTGFEQTAKQDLSLIYVYTSQEGKIPVWVALEIAQTRSSLHRWETCLITWPQTHGYQPKVTQLELEDTRILDNPPIIARYFGFQYLTDDETQLVLYWYESSIFTIHNATQQKHVKLSLITYPEKPEDVPNIKAQLLPIAKTIANYWQPIKTWALISMILSQQGITLAAATTAALAALVIFRVYKYQKTTTDNRRLYQKLSTSSQQLIDIIKKTQETTIPTLANIRETYEKTIHNTIAAAELEQKIIGLERTEIAKTTITSNGDEPTQTWTVQLGFNPRKH
jgi:exosortase